MTATDRTPDSERRYERQLVLLRQLATRLHPDSTVADVAAIVVDAVHDALGADWTVLYRSGPDGGLDLHAAAGEEVATLPARIEPAAAEVLHAVGDGVLMAGLVDADEGEEDPLAVVPGAQLAVAVDDSSSRIGALMVGPRERPYDGADARFLSLFSFFAAPRLAYADIAAAYRSAALVEPVTGFGNRRAFEERLEEELARSNRSAQPLALVLAELDPPRRGAQPSREELLRAVAAAVNRSVRRSDMPFLLDRERIALLLANSDETGAAIVAERVRSGVARLEFAGGAAMTASLGLAALLAGVHKPLSLASLALVRKADDALHQAQRHGGNMVVLG